MTISETKDQSQPHRSMTDEETASHSFSGTVPMSALSPPIRLIHPLLPLTTIQPILNQYPTGPPSKFIPLPLTPHPHTGFLIHPESDLRHGHILANSNSPPNSDPPSLSSLTIRPEILGSQQSTLRPRRAAFISPHPDTSWQETDSQTARPPQLPYWISSLGEVRKVDEIDMEMCVLCGREMMRIAVTVKEFELGGVVGLQAPKAGEEGVAENKGGNPRGDVEQIGLGGSDEHSLGIGRWMVCKDSADCDAAVEQAVFADDEEEYEGEIVWSTVLLLVLI